MEDRELSLVILVGAQGRGVQGRGVYGRGAGAGRLGCSGGEQG